MQVRQTAGGSVFAVPCNMHAACMMVPTAGSVAADLRSAAHSSFSNASASELLLCTRLEVAVARHKSLQCTVCLPTRGWHADGRRDVDAANVQCIWNSMNASIETNL
jgi:hypothetical protein